MTFEDIQEIIAKDEHRCLELKKTTGELQDGLHSACAFLNTDGGWLIFGIAPTSLKILGQQVTDSTQREIAQALAGLHPAVEVKPEYIDVPGRNGDQLIVMHFSGWKWGQMPYAYRGCPYYKNESTTQVMPQEMYEERLRAAKPEKFAWERQEAEGLALADLDEKRIRGAVRLGVERGRMPATAEALREALTNALCHRQLEKYSLTPSIAIYDDRVEIENPGRLPFDLTPETIKSAHASYPYNPLIAEVLFKSSFLESWGSGVGRMVDACRAQGVPEPEYEVAGGFVRMIFRKRIAASGLIQEEDGSKQGVSWEEVGSKLGVSWEEVEKLIVALQNPMLLNDLKELYGWKNASKFKEKYINPLIAEGLADMTVPNKPTSPNQKYCLTEKGKGLLANKISVKQAEGVSDERVNRLIAEFAEALPRFEINLPAMEKQYEATLPIADVRCFQAAYKMKKEMFADNGAWIYETPELYLTEIQTNIWQHYNVQFLMHRADATYKIRFSEIKAALKALGVDGRYAVITSFYLGTYDALYGGEVALKETDYGYQYGEVPIYRVPSHEDRLIVMRKELLPRCEAKVFEGPSKEYRLINEQYLLYSNLFNMKDEGDGLGLAMMRDIKFYLPEDKYFHYVKFMVDRMERVESEQGKIRSM